MAAIALHGREPLERGDGLVAGAGIAHALEDARARVPGRLVALAGLDGLIDGGQRRAQIDAVLVLLGRDGQQRRALGRAGARDRGGLQLAGAARDRGLAAALLESQPPTSREREARRLIADRGVARVGGVEVARGLLGPRGAEAQREQARIVGGAALVEAAQRGQQRAGLTRGPAGLTAGPRKSQLRDVVIGPRLRDRTQVLDRDHRLGCELGQLQRHGPAIVGAALGGEAGLGKGLQLAAVAELLVQPQQPCPRHAQLRPQLQRAHEVAHRTLVVADAAAHRRRAVQQQRARARARDRRDVLLEQTQQHLGAAQLCREVLRGVQRGQVPRPAAQQRLQLGQGLLGAPELAREHRGDLELQRRLAGAIVDVQRLLAQQRDQGLVVAVLAQQSAQGLERGLVIVDRLERTTEVDARTRAVAERQRQLAAAVQQLGRARGAARERDLPLGHAQQLGVATAAREQPRQQLQRRERVGAQLEQRPQVRDRSIDVVVVGVQLRQHRQQEAAPRGRARGRQLRGVERLQRRAIAALVQQALESVARRAVARCRRDRRLVVALGTFDLTQALLEQLARAQVQQRQLLARDAVGLGRADLHAHELEQLRPHAAGAEEARGVLERGHVCRVELERAAHGREPVDGAVEPEQREATDAVVQLRAQGRVLARRQRAQLAREGVERDLVAAHAHGQLLEAAPQAEAVGLLVRRGLQQLQRGLALARVSQRQARARQRHRAGARRARIGLELERVQHQLGVARDLGDAEQIRGQHRVAGLQLERAQQRIAREPEVAAVACLEHREVVQQPRRQRRILQYLELRLEVGDQPEHVAARSGTRSTARSTARSRGVALSAAW
ncbi:MAG: hypothetical protein U0168_13220 [Nannocystaceae bacterium]